MGITCQTPLLANFTDKQLQHKDLGDTSGIVVIDDDSQGFNLWEKKKMCYTGQALFSM